MIFFDFSVEISPSVKGFDFVVSVRIISSLIHSLSQIFFFNFVLIEQSERPGEVLIRLELSVEFCNVNRHQINLSCLFLNF